MKKAQVIAGMPLLWVAALTLSSLGFSFALACAVPLAAFATLAALHMDEGRGIALVSVVWLVNQAVGYGCLGYPMDATTFAWGIALWASAAVAFVAARALCHPVDNYAARAVLAFGAAFVSYEGTLYLVSQFVLGGDTGAYAPTVVAQILWTNAAALVGLLALRRIAVWLGFVAIVDGSNALQTA